MNKDRRKDIARAVELLLSAQSAIEEARGVIDDAANAEREYYDNMPENMQSGDRGQQADTAASKLEEVRDTLQDLDIDQMVNDLGEASE